MRWTTRLYLWPYTRFLYRTLVGRSRSRGHAEQGRFTRNDARRITEEAWAIARELRGSAPREQAVGGRLMLNGGVWSLAIFRAIRGLGVPAEYATELCTDYLWAAYQSQVTVQRWLGHLLARGPEAQMARIQGIFLRFPLGAPGYDCRVREVPGSFAYDIHRCPVHDYFATQGPEALEFFRNSWCTLDYPLAEHLVRGGRYERRRTLSAGDAMCDMRWMVREVGSEIHASSPRTLTPDERKADG